MNILRTKRIAAWAAALLALAGVFIAYLRPALIVDLATRVWSCF
ncbi:MAG TPA: hypothetical protein VFV25_11575 [Methylibium sp.]